jgi:hypothetical protein
LPTRPPSTQWSRASSSSRHDLAPLSEVQGLPIDLNELDSLEETFTMLDEVGLT